MNFRYCGDRDVRGVRLWGERCMGVIYFLVRDVIF